MKRLYFLVPNLDTAQNVIAELKKHDVFEDSIHLIGKEHHQFEAAHLHRAGIFQTTDFKRALKRGLLIGGILGVIAGIFAYYYNPASLNLGIGSVIGIIIFGLIFGAWVSTLIGVSVIKPNIVRFEKAIEAGKFLVLVDIPKGKEEEIVSLIKKQHEEAIVEQL